MMKNKIQYAFIKSLPVLFGYVFLGIAYGIVLQQAGYNALWALGISSFVFAGSAQFVLVPMMAAGTSLITVAITILFVNSRHLFYGLSFTESFSKLKSKPYMIFSLTDETYSVFCGCRNEDPEEKMRDTWPLIAFFDQGYWVLGSVVGALLGEVLPFDMTGIDFSMTALFVVILVDQVRNNLKSAGKVALSSIIIAVICLFVFGTGNFLLPTLIISVLVVFVLTGGFHSDEKNPDRRCSE